MHFIQVGLVHSSNKIIIMITNARIKTNFFKDWKNPASILILYIKKNNINFIEIYLKRIKLLIFVAKQTLGTPLNLLIEIDFSRTFSLSLFLASFYFPFLLIHDDYVYINYACNPMYQFRHSHIANIY